MKRKNNNRRDTIERCVSMPRVIEEKKKKNK